MKGEMTSETSESSSSSSPSACDTRRRVKLYTLNNSRQWDDRGTGHVRAVCNNENEQGQVLLVVRAEVNGDVLLESKIQSDTAYQKQQETLIVWSETESSDLALSFQEKTGCDEIWEKICQVQGKDPSVDITQDMPGDEDEDDDDLQGSMNDHNTSSSPFDLPKCEIGKMEEIHDTFSYSMRSPPGRENLAKAIEETDYIPKLLDLFSQMEDLEDTENLKRMFDCIKYTFMLNKTVLFEVLVSEENVMKVIGCLEYDPQHTQPRQHRRYLEKEVTFKEVFPITNVELRKKIHQTFKLQYIQDVVLPTPSVFDENMLSTLASVIFFNKVEIVSLVQEDTQLLPNLFKEITDDSISDERRCELAGFLRELCTLSQTLQPPPKDEYFKNLTRLGLLPSIEHLFGCEDSKSHRIAIDIFQHCVEHSPTMVREFCKKEMQRENSSSESEEDAFLINMVIERMICDPDQELSGAMQLNGLLRILLDPENMMGKTSEKAEFLTLFYRYCMHVLMAPLLANTATESGPSKDDYQTCNILSLILDLVTFSVENHQYHVKHYIQNKDLLRRVLVLLKSKHRFLVLAALRFMRKIVGRNDDFYNRYIIKGDLFKPVVEQLFKSGSSYNLINSAILEMFEFVQQEKPRGLISYIVQQHFDVLDRIEYVKTFKKLKTTYDQQQDRSMLNQLNSSRSSVGTSDTLSPYAGPNHRRFPSNHRRDNSSMDEEEEMWFDRDDDEEKSLDLDVQAKDDCDPPTKMSIDSSVFEDSPPAGSKDKIFQRQPNTVFSSLEPKKLISINIASLKKSNGKSDEQKPSSLGTGVKKIGSLVDYSDDDDTDEEEEEKSSKEVTSSKQSSPDSTTPPTIDQLFAQDSSKNKLAGKPVESQDGQEEVSSTTGSISSDNADSGSEEPKVEASEAQNTDSTSKTEPEDDSNDATPLSEKTVSISTIITTNNTTESVEPARKKARMSIEVVEENNKS